MNTRINQVNTPISNSFQFHAVKMPNHAFCKTKFLKKNPSEYFTDSHWSPITCLLSA